jgi:hypothetical protein
MNDPRPSVPPTPAPSAGWVPTTSTWAGGGLGLAAAQIVCGLWQHFTHSPVDAPTAAAIATVCTAAIGYFFPDGGRR